MVGGLSTPMLKDNNGWVFEYSDVERHESRKNIASTTINCQPLAISSLAMYRKRNNSWGFKYSELERSNGCGFEYSDVERGIMVECLSTQN